MKKIKMTIDKFKELINLCRRKNARIKYLEEVIEYLNKQIEEYNRRFANDKS